MRKRFDLENAYPYFAMLKKQKAGTIDSWAIRWYLSVFMRDGLVLYPQRSLVSNEGFDGTGEHCPANGEIQITNVGGASERLTRFPADVVDESVFRSVKGLLRSQNTFLQRGRRYAERRFL